MTDPVPDKPPVIHVTVDRKFFDSTDPFITGIRSEVVERVITRLAQRTLQAFVKLEMERFAESYVETVMRRLAERIEQEVEHHGRSAYADAMRRVAYDMSDAALRDLLRDTNLDQRAQNAVEQYLATISEQRAGNGWQKPQ